MKIVIFGLSITSSWGNGHATTYRGLVRELAKLGHEILFLERDVPWYATSRDLPSPPYCRTVLYNSVDLLLSDYGREIIEADCVIVGSYVPDGIEIGRWVTRKAKGITAFYDIDTPVTLAKLERGDCEYLNPELIPIYRLYLSFTGGQILERIREQYGAREAVPLYCSVDPEVHYPMQQPARWDLGYLGTYSTDRQSPLERMLCETANLWKEGRFVVAGAQYPAGIAWPDNMKHIEHLPPEQHRDFYSAQRFTLNITRKYMIQAGYSPSVRLFEAAACAVPVISDQWPGIEEFFIPGEEILLASTAEEVLGYLRELSDEDRQAMGQRARKRVLRSHTAGRRATELLNYIAGCEQFRSKLPLSGGTHYGLCRF
ncbi:glycosyltransferase, putative [Geotalea daltonii FRC-32]|uniref:Glycosyltransferase, putative n=1 Tax=Geotalea daltonii (strain DSM 22248 / JCM 15807 / FRC-32) TaxID=316067 RepID=B9M4D5_GEODF|nr:glycosyltransferase [Geotalea daltonii]ACM21590.1 glycosyltransferase, putative [Geotalea daltonii FRC-32]